MKVCPKCSQTYGDESLNYCLNDGTVLISATENKTAEMNHSSHPTANNPTARYTNYAPAQSEQTVVQQTVQKKSNPILWVLLILGGLVLICGGGFAGLYAFYVAQNSNNANLTANDLLANKNSSDNATAKPSLTRQSPKSEPDQNGVTLEKFKKLEPKMSYKQAVEILGSEGSQMSSSGSGSYKTEMYKWSEGDTEFIIAMFMNDKLMTKSQSGLSKIVNESLTLEKYNQLKNGMKYEEAAAILGEGDEQSVTEIMGSRVTSYQWRGEEFAYITAAFQNGKMTSKSQFGLK